MLANSNAPVACLALAATLATCALLAACGGSSDLGASSSADRQEAALKFSRCMREHGVANFPNPEISEGHVQLHVRSGGPGGVQATPQVMEAAQKACQRYQEALAPKLTPQEKVQREEAVRRFTACMRQHGIHVESGGGPGGGLAIKIHSTAGEGPNPESPTFQKAQEDCSKLLPGGGPKGKLPPLSRRRTGAPGGSTAGEGQGSISPAG